MPQHNLTRVEAAERASLLSVTSYDVTLVLDGQGETFRSVTTVRFTAHEGASSFIDAITASVDRLVLNGEELDAAALRGDARIELPHLAAENELVVDARFFYMNTGEGMHRFVDPVDDEVYLYSQFEVPDSRRVFAVFEQPDLKASFSFTVLAPQAWTVVSNAPTPQPEDPAAIAGGLNIAAEGLAAWIFAPTPPISSYITAIIAGPYRSVHDAVRSSDGEEVALGVYCRASLFEYLDAQAIIGITKAGFEFYEAAFDTPYPFEKYDQLFVPEFNAGAMENAGAVTIVENYVFRSRPTEAIVERRAVTILHELAHMWFGDLVTMKWWNDLWLNESFAEFMSTLATAEATEFASAWTTFASLEKSWAYRQDQLPSTHPIVAPIEDLADVEVNFDGITYAKGASVLKQLVAWVGRENFFGGLKAYFDAHSWSNTELPDLLRALSEASGRDLDSWTRLWLQESGINVVRPLVETDEQGRLTRLALVQEPFAIAGQPVPSLRPHRIGVGLYALEGRTLVRTGFAEVDLDSALAEVPLDLGGPRPDAIIVNDADLSYAKVRFDEATLATVLARLDGFEDSLTQVIVLTTLWDMVRDGELPVSDYIAALTRHLPSIEQSTALLVQFRQLATALGSYLAPEARSAARARLAAALWDMLATAPAGSDQQFQCFQAFVKHAQTPDQLDRLAAILAGSAEAPAGIVIDTDLRWELIIALAAAERLDAEAIARWRESDDTAAGRRAAATALAAPATSEAKSRAFTMLSEDRELPNAMVAAIARGFGIGLERPDGSPVAAEAPLDAFAAEYFARLAGWWETRTLEIAQTLTLALYPPASEAAVAATRVWLDSHPAAPKGLVRLMRENLDTAERALAIRAADREGA
ncbi:aminopeptidase N [Brevibacterium sp. BRM-1]|uniref:aminopeptidase N n=1 Tax=Brevibacterium sp. BRM-1 TaxID=2999062 RepID=UPI00227F671A|nr:aminopeptidase N [Brevibacterium sp. BRM-1]WAL40577.1 aminopeptidase N [Brevibacterium sp. BRM-1]